MFESGFKRFPFEEYNPPFNFMECHWLFRLLSLDYGQDICASIFRHPGSLSWKKVKHFEFFTLILNLLLFLSTVGHRTKTLDFYWPEWEKFYQVWTNKLNLSGLQIGKLVDKSYFPIFSFLFSPLSPFDSFMYQYHSFVSLGTLIYYIFLWGIVFLFSPLLSFCDRSHWVWVSSSLVMFQLDTRGPVSSHFCSICYSHIVHGVLETSQEPHLSHLHQPAAYCQRAAKTGVISECLYECSLAVRHWITLGTDLFFLIF